MKQFIQTHKLLCIVLACVLVAGITCAIVLPIALKHEHTYATEWTADETNHWHAATCEHTEERRDFGEHKGEWTIKTEADYGVDKVEEWTCAVCGKYQERTVENSALAAKDNAVLVGAIDFTYNANSQPIDSLVSADNMEGMLVEYVGVDGTTYEKSTTAPKNAGTYRYTITIPATAEWKAAEKSGEYTIKKYELTEVYEKTHTKEYSGTIGVSVKVNPFGTEEFSVNIAMKSAAAGTKEIQKVWVVGTVAKDNYTVDPSKVKAEIVAKKLTNLKFEIEEANVDTMVSEQTITRKIAGVTGEEIEVEITFDPNELINEDALELSFDGKGGATCIIKFKTENPNYELDLTLGELILKKSATV